MYKDIKNKGEFEWLQVNTNQILKTLNLNDQPFVIGGPWQWGLCPEKVKIKK
jgi:hypothetical protein